MKKIMKKMMAFMLMLLCLPVALVSGGNAMEAVRAEEAETETILLNGFETSAHFNYLTMSNCLGQVTMNTDAAYVRDGAASVKLYVQPDLFSGRMDAKIPGLYHGLKLVKEGLDYTNFRYVNKVTASVYNAEDTVQEIGLQIVYTVKNRSLVTGKAQWYELQPKEWTEITFEIGSTTIPVAYKKKAYGLNFLCKRETFITRSMLRVTL